MSMPDKWEYPWFAAWDLAFHCVALAHSTRRSPSTSCCCCAGSGSSTPTGPCPPTSGTSATSTRPCRPGRRSRCSPSTAPATSTSSAACSTSCWSTSPGGSTARTPAARTCSRAASWGWTTSARSTAPTCRSAARSSSPTPPAGWPSTRSPWPPSPRSCTARAGGPRSTWCSSSSSTSPRSARPWTPWGCGTTPTASTTTSWSPPTGPRCRSRSGRWSASSRCSPPSWSTRRRSRGPGRWGRSSPGCSTELGGPGRLVEQGLLRGEPGDRRLLLGVVGVERLARLLAKLFDEREFLSPYGLRALSAYHRDHPYELKIDGVRAAIDYEPAESTTEMFGGNSNWRGPVWFPLNYLLISALERYHRFFGDELTVEYPTGGPGHPGPGRRRPAPAAHRPVPRRAGRAAALLRGGRPPPARPRLERQPASSTSTSTATTAPGSAPPTRRAGPGWSPTSSAGGRGRRGLRHRRPGPGPRPAGRVVTAAASHRVRVRPGRRFPLGATPGPGGTNFAVSSGVADGMLLCLFDDAGAETRIALPDYDAGVLARLRRGCGRRTPWPAGEGPPERTDLRPGPHLVEQLLPAGRIYL